MNCYSNRVWVYLCVLLPSMSLSHPHILTFVLTCRHVLTLTYHPYPLYPPIHSEMPHAHSSIHMPTPTHTHITHKAPIYRPCTCQCSAGAAPTPLFIGEVVLNAIWMLLKRQRHTHGGRRMKNSECHLLTLGCVCVWSFCGVPCFSYSRSVDHSLHTHTQYSLLTSYLHSI